MSNKIIKTIQRMEKNQDDRVKGLLKFCTTPANNAISNAINYLNSRIDKKIVNVPKVGDYFSLRHDSFGRRVIVKQLQRNSREYGRRVEVYFERPDGKLLFQGNWHIDEVCLNQKLFTAAEREGLAIKYQKSLEEGRPKSKFAVKNPKYRPISGDFVKKIEKPLTKQEKKERFNDQVNRLAQELMENINFDIEQES